MQTYINGKFLTQPISGVQRYALELTKCAVEQIKGVLILVPRKFNTRKTGIPAKYFVKTGDYKNLNLWEQIHLPAYINKRKGLLINLCNSAPLLIKNQIVCLHDIAFIRNPQWYSRLFYLYYRFLIPKVLKNSRHIITVSEFSKKEIKEHFGLADEKISVIYNAPAPGFICPSADQLRFQKENFYLFVGSFDPRKNLKTLLQAFSSPQLKSAKLIVVGKRWKTFAEDDLSVPQNVTLLEDCDDVLLSYLYARARALINCSLYEGFGLPLVEAMANGCELLLSDIPVFREIAGDNAVYFPPLDADAIVKAINTLEQRDNSAVERAVKNNYHYSFKFSWTKSSNRLLHGIQSITLSRPAA